MKVVTIAAKEIRLPGEAVAALEGRSVVAVTHYGRRRHVILSDEDFALVEPLLELLRDGADVPAEMLMTKEDIALERALAEDREPSPGEEELIEEILAERLERS
ncbi:MAG: hypothetical protein WD067_08210 [Gaiellaceae bacterium]